jgi:Domain of unknown function (DUF1918)
MEAQIGDNIVFESERVGQPAHSGVIEEVLKQQPPRYRVRWEDGHESIRHPRRAPPGSSRRSNRPSASRVATED